MADAAVLVDTDFIEFCRDLPSYSCCLLVAGQGRACIFLMGCSTTKIVFPSLMGDGKFVRELEDDFLWVGVMWARW